MSNAEKLLQLATQEFKKLSAAERKVIEAAANGEEAWCWGDGDYDTDLDNAQAWSSKRVIRADVIRWLCANQLARELVDARGIQIAFARIDEELDLSYVEVPFPLHINSCAVNEDLTLSNATLRALSLDGSRTKSIWADTITVKGDISLAHEFLAEGVVDLMGASIAGDVDCHAGKFKNPKGHALYAHGINVKGDVFLRDKFIAEGEVGLVGASIGGNLDCAAGTFKDPKGDALSADGAKVKGSVFLGNNFNAEGEVRFVGATIGGGLNCSVGTFKNAEGPALSTDGIDVKGSVFLNDKFIAEGEVRLRGATIGGSLECNASTFKNPKGTALNAEGIDVKGSVFLRDKFIAEGEVFLLGATIGGDLDCTAGAFKNPKGSERPAASEAQSARDRKGKSNASEKHAICLERAKISKALMVAEGFKALGKVSFAHAVVGQLWDDTNCWPDKGKLDIAGFVYGAIDKESPTSAEERLKWLGLQDPKHFSLQPYEQLARVFRQSGQERDAKEVLIAKEAHRRRHGDLGPVGKAWNRFLGFSIGYGHRTHRVLSWAMLFLILGTFLFGLGKQHGLMIAAKAGPGITTTEPAPTGAKEKRPAPPGDRPFNAIAYSIDALVPLVNLHQEEYWLPSPKTFWGAALRIYLWVHICMGWFLITLGIAGLTRIVRK